MDEDEDDFYGGANAQSGQADYEMAGAGTRSHIKAEDENMSEEEEEDSDDDVQFTLEKPEVVKNEAPSQSNPVSKATDVKSSSPQPTRTRQATASAPIKQESATGHVATLEELLHNGKEGKDYPEVRTSNVELDDDPVWPADGKKISEVDIDADLAEHSKPWRLPGTDITDFFNYGFDEYTWTQYCARQQNMANTISDMRDEDAKMKSMLGGTGEGMPDMNTMMQMMMGGMNPSSMNAGQMPFMGIPGMPQGQQIDFGAAAGNISPFPQPEQGFQAPFGAAGVQDGFNQQQMMQQEQQAPPQQQFQGQGGGRGRARRGRGYH